MQQVTQNGTSLTFSYNSKEQQQVYISKKQQGAKEHKDKRINLWIWEQLNPEYHSSLIERTSKLSNQNSKSQQKSDVQINVEDPDGILNFSVLSIVCLFWEWICWWKNACEWVRVCSLYRVHKEKNKREYSILKFRNVSCKKGQYNIFFNRFGTTILLLYFQHLLTPKKGQLSNTRNFWYFFTLFLTYF